MLLVKTDRQPKHEAMTEHQNREICHYLVHISWVKIWTISNPNRQNYLTNDLTLDLKEASINKMWVRKFQTCCNQHSQSIGGGLFLFTQRVIDIFKQYFSKTNIILQKWTTTQVEAILCDLRGVEAQSYSFVCTNKIGVIATKLDDNI